MKIDFYLFCLKGPEKISNYPNNLLLIMEVSLTRLSN